jgi:hypothetical protein
VGNQEVEMNDMQPIDVAPAPGPKKSSATEGFNGVMVS